MAKSLKELYDPEMIFYLDKNGAVTSEKSLYYHTDMTLSAAGTTNWKKGITYLTREDMITDFLKEFIQEEFDEGFFIEQKKFKDISIEDFILCGDIRNAVIKYCVVHDCDAIESMLECFEIANRLNKEALSDIVEYFFYDAEG